MLNYQRCDIECIADDDVFCFCRLKAVFQQDIQEEINGDFNGSQIKAFREKGLKIRDILSIF